MKKKKKSWLTVIAIFIIAPVVSLAAGVIYYQLSRSAYVVELNSTTTESTLAHVLILFTNNPLQMDQHKIESSSGFERYVETGQPDLLLDELKHRKDLKVTAYFWPRVVVGQEVSGSGEFLVKGTKHYVTVYTRFAGGRNKHQYLYAYLHAGKIVIDRGDTSLMYGSTVNSKKVLKSHYIVRAEEVTYVKKAHADKPYIPQSEKPLAQ